MTILVVVYIKCMSNYVTKTYHHGIIRFLLQYQSFQFGTIILSLKFQTLYISISEFSNYSSQNEQINLYISTVFMRLFTYRLYATADRPHEKGMDHLIFDCSNPWGYYIVICLLEENNVICWLFEF